MPAQTAQHIILVTGPSGAGRTTAIGVLEDMGCEVIDNLPLSLVPRLLDGPPLGRAIALGVDVRNRDFSTAGLIELIDRLTADPDTRLDVLYLDCQPDVLVQRYSQTKRRHPLLRDQPPVMGITSERDLLVPIMMRADVLIDTSDMSPHDLKAEIALWMGLAPAQRMAVSVQSFSYKRGLPRGVDMVFDCRFLDNPHWVGALRALDGRDAPVVAHVEADPLFDDFFNRMSDLVRLLLPAQISEGKSHLAIAFGCTGGQHRSVVVACRLARELEQAGWPVSLRHRELERAGRVGSGHGVIKQAGA